MYLWNVFNEGAQMNVNNALAEAKKYKRSKEIPGQCKVTLDEVISSLQ